MFFAFFALRLGVFFINVFFGDVSSEEFLFFGEGKGFPFLDDFGDEFRLSHSWELMSVFVVFLSGKLSVEFCELIFVELSSTLALHTVFKEKLLIKMNFIFIV